MRIGVVGTGYVGLVSGTCFAEFGIDVVCVDKDAGKIDRLKAGEIPIYEPGLDDLVAKQVAAGRLSFTTDLAQAVRGSDAVFIAVGTPPRKDDGHADLSYVYQAARDIGAHMTGYTVVVTKSTVPVGTAREIEKILRQVCPNGEFDVCSNPEFLREGAAITDFLRPDRVVLGATSDRAIEVLRALYRPLYLNETPIAVTTPETAEIIKYASNAFLATKISFINEIANLCEKAGANVQDVARAMGLDGRIGAKFLHAGPGYGGSCFPKDTLALAQTGRDFGAPQRIVEAVIQVNADRQRAMAEKIIAACGGSVKDLKIGVLGVAFKPNTDDVRDAPSLVVLPALQAAGAKIHAFDPAAMDTAAPLLPGIVWCKDAYEAANGTDALVILTEWNEFRALNLDRIGESMSQKRLIDLRNIYKIPEMRGRGFHYVSIGRPEVEGDRKSVRKAS
ncbi:MAG: UDP-glucose/GDP-mannose dehydrogenase family protein [Rhodospirillales bacterium]|nr:UDP-glucose/GDP-mannose dehydrogenase family protein [Rhodospirillales bacterium]